MAAFGRFSVRFLRTVRLVKARNDTSDTHNAATTRRRLVVREVQEGSSEGDRETDGGRERRCDMGSGVGSGLLLAAVLLLRWRENEEMARA